MARESHSGNPPNEMLVHLGSQVARAAEARSGTAHRERQVLEAINTVLHKALMCHSQADLAHTCLNVAQDLTGAAFGFMGLLNSSGRLDVVAITDPGWSACHMADPDLPRRIRNMKLRGLFGWVLKNGRSLMANDPATHPVAVGLPPGHPRLDSFLGVPLSLADEAIGIIGLGNKPEGFQQGDRLSLEQLSPVMVEALMRKRAESALVSAHENLERQVHERTIELQQTNQVLQREVARRRKVEEKLMLRWQRLAAIFSSFPEIIAVSDPDDHSILFASEPLARRLGGEPLGTPCYQTVLGNDAPCHKCMAQRAEPPGQPHCWEHYHPVHERYYFMVSQTIKWPESPERVLTIAIDISSRKQAEQELERSRETLARKARELKRSNVELEQFAYMVSHDLQEPLRAVSGFMALLQRQHASDLSPSANEFIQYARDGARRMQRMIENLLELSRVQIHDQALATVDSRQVLLQAVEALRISIQESRARVTSDSLPLVIGDRSQMLRLFHNLVGNAIKFAGDSPPQVHVSATTQDGWATFTVRDNGVGIDPRHHERIFGVFQRLRTRPDVRGDGVGLAICKRIVQLTGGRIWVESSPGQGAAFKFTMPLPGPEPSGKLMP